MPPTRTVRSPALDIAYEDSGRADGPAVVLLHGFPYSVRAFDAVVPILTAAGLRTIVPHLRGYGPTRFLDRDTPRSGQQGAIGQDLLDLLDALGIARAVLAGFDWGGRAACVVSALWPERVAGLASCTGYLIQDIATAAKPADPEQEHRFWYQWYFHTERGRNGLTNDRAALCRLLWRQWSPGWAFDEATLAATTALFDNPNFVDVVIHSYRHRAGNAPVIRALPLSRPAWQPCRRSQCRPSRSKAPATASTRRARSTRSDGISQAPTSDASCPASATTHRRRLQQSSPPPCSISPAVP